MINYVQLMFVACVHSFIARWKSKFSSILDPLHFFNINEFIGTKGVLSGRLFVSKHMSHEKNPPTFHYTGWLIGILTMVYYNPYIPG